LHKKEERIDLNQFEIDNQMWLLKTNSMDLNQGLNAVLAPQVS
jgi:hypothetical protein